jgi:hypothetical protein
MGSSMSITYFQRLKVSEQPQDTLHTVARFELPFTIVVSVIVRKQINHFIAVI